MLNNISIPFKLLLVLTIMIFMRFLLEIL